MQGEKRRRCAKMLTMIIWGWGEVGWNLGRFHYMY